MVYEIKPNWQHGSAGLVILFLHGHEIMRLAVEYLQPHPQAVRSWLASSRVRDDMIDAFMIARDECIDRGIIKEA